MSIILDALKRGRLRPAPRQNPDTAQTDAVLQTLGYKRFSPTTPLNRLKRVVAYLVVAGVCALVLWGGNRLDYADGFRDAAGRAGPRVPAKASGSTAFTASAGSVAGPIDNGSRDARTGSCGAADSCPIAIAPGAPHDSPQAVPGAGVLRRPQNRRRRPSAPGTISFGRALMYQRLGDFENALVSYRQVLQRDDLNVEAHNNLGVLYRDKGLFDDAITHFQRAIAINPRYARARNNLGVVFLNQRKLDAAATQFHAALAIDPNNVESLVNLSTVDKDSQCRRRGARLARPRAGDRSAQCRSALQPRLDRGRGRRHAERDCPLSRISPVRRGRAFDSGGRRCGNASTPSGRS